MALPFGTERRSLTQRASVRYDHWTTRRCDRLVAEAQAWRPEAFGRSSTTTTRRSIASSPAASIARADAEDLTQLVFVKALEALPRYEARGIPFGGWLFRLARNAIIDHVRTRRDHVDLEPAIDRPAATPGPDEIAALRQDARRRWPRPWQP